MGEEFHGPAPGRFLATVEFAQIEDVALKNASAHDAAVFDNAPVGMFLAILATFLAAQKHERIKPLLDKIPQGGRSALQALWERDPREIKGSSALKG